MKIVIGILFLALPALAQIPAAVPNGEVSQFVAAFNASTPDVLSAYVRTHVVPGAAPGPRPDTAQALQRLRQAIGTINVVAVHDLPRRIVATVRAQRGGWYHLNFLRAPAQAGANRFGGIVADLGLPPKGPAQSAQAYVSELASGGYFSGVVLSAKP